MSDYTHFTMRGGDRAAEGFYTALMNVHRKKSDRPKLDVSGKESRAIRFNSASYAWFLAFVIRAGLALRKKPEIRLIFLAAASYFFMLPGRCGDSVPCCDYGNGLLDGAMY